MISSSRRLTLCASLSLSPSFTQGTSLVRAMSMAIEGLMFLPSQRPRGVLLLLASSTSLGIVLLCWTTIKMCRWFHTPLPWSNGTSLQEILCRPSNLPKNPLTCCVQWILSCHLQTASSLCFTSILQLLSSTIILTT